MIVLMLKIVMLIAPAGVSYFNARLPRPRGRSATGSPAVTDAAVARGFSIVSTMSNRPVAKPACQLYEASSAASCDVTTALILAWCGVDRWRRETRAGVRAPRRAEGERWVWRGARLGQRPGTGRGSGGAAIHPQGVGRPRLRSCRQSGGARGRLARRPAGQVVGRERGEAGAAGAARGAAPEGAGPPPDELLLVRLVAAAGVGDL